MRWDILKSKAYLPENCNRKHKRYAESDNLFPRAKHRQTRDDDWSRVVVDIFTFYPPNYADESSAIDTGDCHPMATRLQNIRAFNTNTGSQQPNVNRRSVDLDWINACVFQGLVHQSRSMPNAPLLYHKSVQTLLNQFDGFLFNSLFRRFRRSAVTSQLISSIRLIFLCVWPSVFLCVLLTANNFTLLGSLRSSDEKWTSRQVRGRPNVSPKKTKRRESLQNVVFFRTSQSASLPIALGQ